MSVNFIPFFYRGLKAAHKILGKTIKISCRSLRMKSSLANREKISFVKNNAKIWELELKYIFVRTCVDFWEDLPVGVLFDTAYIDSQNFTTGVGYNTDTPVVVALHDSPGSSVDLIQILQPFSNLGYRVIAPDFPGFGSTKGVGKYDDHTFTGKTDERVDFLCNFLAQLGIERVDLLIGHGSGCNTAVSVTAAMVRKKIIKSLALINPVGHRHRRLGDYISAIEFATLWDQKPLMKPFLRLALIHAAHTKLKFLQRYPFKQHVKVMLHFAGFQYELVSSDISTIGSSSIPRLIIYSKDNIFVDEEVIAEYADIFGMPSSNFCHCDSDGKFTKPETNNSALKGVVFEEGFDSILQKHTGQLTLLLQELLKNVIKKKW